MKVVITGMGVVSPLGNSVETFWKALCEGRSGIRAIDRFDTSDLPTVFAGLVEPCMPADFGSKDVSRRDAYVIYALVAADEAWKQAGIDMEREDPYRCGASVGSGIGGLDTIVEQVGRFHEQGPRRVAPMTVPKILINMAAGEIGIRYGLRGPNKAIVTACASATQCIGEAAHVIQRGEADVMLAGGAEAPVGRFGLSCFSALRALSRRNDEPQRASRPFDLDRDGFVMAEGAGVLVLESEEHARARGAEILGEIAGHGETCDAYHVTAPDPEGAGAVAAMRAALKAAKLEPGAIGHFNAHGTSTKHNEIAEAKALRAVFGEDMPPVTSTKSMTGHLLGAAGAIEAVASVLTIRDGIIPPTINYDTPDPEAMVNLVANEAREERVEIVMSNSLGFGGHNASLILKRYA